MQAKDVREWPLLLRYIAANIKCICISTLSDFSQSHHKCSPTSSGSLEHRSPANADVKVNLRKRVNDNLCDTFSMAAQRANDSTEQNT